MSKSRIDPSQFTPIPVEFVMEIDGIHVFHHPDAIDTAQWLLIDARNGYSTRAKHKAWIMLHRFVKPADDHVFSANHLDIPDDLRRRIAATLSLLES